MKGYDLICGKRLEKTDRLQRQAVCYARNLQKSANHNTYKMNHKSPRNKDRRYYLNKPPLFST